MKRYLLSGLALLALSCSPKILPTQSDSVRVEYRDRIVTVHDTAVFEVPQIIERIVTRDTTSHLENDWASSDAVVSGGLLEHSLQTRPHVVRVPVETFVEVHDTTIVERQAETIVVEKAKPLTKWQSFQLVLGDIALALLAAALLTLILKLILKK